MHIRKTNSASCDLEKKLALPKRRPGNLLHAEFVISRNQRLHHKWLVTSHVSLITTSNAFTKQALTGLGYITKCLSGPDGGDLDEFDKFGLKSCELTLSKALLRSAKRACDR